MEREILAHLPVVLAVSRRGGFAAAAAALGMSPSAVSHAVKLVEDRLGLPLFARTTRSVALTEAGHGFLGAVAPALAAIEEAALRVRSARGRVAGLLRINAPRIALPIALAPVMAELAQHHPDLTIEVTTEDGLVDIVAGGFDAGVRLGGMIAEDMIAIRLTPPFSAILVASPAYLAARGVPEAIGDLARHNCIGFRLLSTGAAYAWDLKQDGEDVSVQVGGTARITDPLAARDLALAGLGIAYIFEPLVQGELASRRLVQLIPEASFEEPGLYLYFPRGSAETPKLRAFIDTVKAIGSRPLPR